jgi:hypothetical protein
LLTAGSPHDAAPGDAEGRRVRGGRKDEREDEEQDARHGEETSVDASPTPVEVSASMTRVSHYQSSRHEGGLDGGAMRSQLARRHPREEVGTARGRTSVACARWGGPWHRCSTSTWGSGRTAARG